MNAHSEMCSLFCFVHRFCLEENVNWIKISSRKRKRKKNGANTYICWKPALFLKCIPLFWLLNEDFLCSMCILEIYLKPFVGRLPLIAYRLLVDSNMAVRSFLNDNLNMNFDASVEMDSRVHFADSEIQSLGHLVRQNVDSCHECHHI